MRRAIAAGLLLLLVVLTDATFAGPFEDGFLAFARRDYGAAIRILQPLAEEGNARAAFFLGYMYDQGLGAEGSSDQAAIWFRKAAEQGDAVSQATLGYLYSAGDGVPQNSAEAMKWSLFAAKQDDPGAQYRIGTFYEAGFGAPKNPVLAYMWFSLSAHDPIYGALASRHMGALALAPSQVDEARSLAQQCAQSNYEVCKTPQVEDFDTKRIGNKADLPQPLVLDEGSAKNNRRYVRCIGRTRRHAKRCF
jgi:TPR repeat protein